MRHFKDGKELAAALAICAGLFLLGVAIVLSGDYWASIGVRV